MPRSLYGPCNSVLCITIALLLLITTTAIRLSNDSYLAPYDLDSMPCSVSCRALISILQRSSPAILLCFISEIAVTSVSIASGKSPTHRDTRAHTLHSGWPQFGRGGEIFKDCSTTFNYIFRHIPAIFYHARECYGTI